MENIDQITQLLQERKFDDVRKIIEDFLNQQTTPQQQGEAAFNKAMVFIKAKTEINKNFLTKANQILDEISKLEKNSDTANAEKQLQELRNRIKDL